MIVSAIGKDTVSMAVEPDEATQRAGIRRYTDCDALRASDAGRTVTLKGWVNRRRDHGGLIFLDIRDRYGVTQVVANPTESPAAHEVAQDLRNEYVVSITGLVAERPEGTKNPSMATGDIEVHAEGIEVLDQAPARPSRSPARLPEDRVVVGCYLIEAGPAAQHLGALEDGRAAAKRF